MFEGLKKKFSGFIDSLVKKEEDKQAKEAIDEKASVPDANEMMHGIREPEKANESEKENSHETHDRLIESKPIAEEREHITDLKAAKEEIKGTKNQKEEFV